MRKLLINKYRYALFIFISIHFLLIFLTGVFRYWGNLTSINDLGVFDQAVWGGLHGDLFLNTSQLNERINWLAFHFHPVLLIFIPFYYLISSPLWFVSTQALAISLTAWPIYLLGKRIFNTEKAAVIWAMIYLVNPFVLNAAAWDFHPISLAVPFVALGMLSVETKDFRLMLLSAFILLLCKEHLGIMVAGFGVLWWIKNRQWIPGMTLIIAGIGHFYLVLKIIMPALSPTGQHVMVSDGLGQLSRYAWLGQSVGEVIGFVLLNPVDVIGTVLFKMGGLIYLLSLLISFLGFPLLCLSMLFPAAADLATNLLSSNPMPRASIAYHSVTLIPIFTAASIYGIKNTAKWIQRFSVIKLSGLVLIASIILGYCSAPLPLPWARNFWAPVSFVSLPDPRIHEIGLGVGQDASISVQANVGSHFSQRKEIYRFPNKLDEVDAVVLWLDTPTKNVHIDSENRRHYLGTLDNLLQIDRDDFISSVKGLLEDSNFGVLYWNDPWLVFKRGVDIQQDTSEIKKKIEKLEREW